MVSQQSPIPLLRDDTDGLKINIHRPIVKWLSLGSPKSPFEVRILMGLPKLKLRQASLHKYIINYGV